MGASSDIFLRSSEVLTTVSIERPHLHRAVPVHKAGARHSISVAEADTKGRQGPQGDGTQIPIHPINYLDLCCWFLLPQDHGAGR